jgi:N-acetylneuraminate synthase
MKSILEINGRKIGEGCPVYIIAEGCDNHMGNMDVAKEMCRQANLAGADCIKFQHHLPDEEMLKDVPMSSNFDIPLYDFLKLHALTLDQHIELMAYCKEIGIQYLCTPFSLKAAYELNEIGVDAFKIGSGEMTDIPSLLKIAELGKPMIISTGMSTLDEIQRTYDALVPMGVPIAFTNCLSEYPPKYEDVNLNVIKKMKERFPLATIGHSDHTPDLYTCYAAVALGATMIEKHVILSKQTPGPDQSVSIDFHDLYCLCDGIHKVEKALGDEKVVHENEKAIREWAFRSIVTKCKINKGETIESSMIWSKRPGTGIPSHKMNDVIGKKAIHDIDENVLLKYEDFE